MKEIISASRRTDMPRWYLDRLIRFIGQGYAEVANPYSGKTTVVDLRPERVHTLVLWSKDFGRFLAESARFKEYRLYFLFTVNDMPELEPGIPDLPVRLEQARELVSRFGPESVAWRYDPVVFRNGVFASTLRSFERIGGYMAGIGVERVIFSFLDLYGKVKARNERLGLNIADPPRDLKLEYASRLASIARTLGLRLQSCCEDLKDIEGITPSACIDGELLARLSGEPADTRKDKGQRPLCNCTVSRDIGSYRDMPCFGGCLYCYANPVVPRMSGKDS